MAKASLAMDDPAPLTSWFPSLEELDAYARRRREERAWEPAPFCPPTLDPASVIVLVEECD